MAWKRLDSLAVLAGLALMLVTPPPSLAVDADEWVAAWVAGFNTAIQHGNIEALMGGWTDNSLHVHPMLGTLRGREGQQKFYQTLYSGFTDQKLTARRTIAQGNIIALEWTWESVHRESRKPIKLDEFGVFEVDSAGKIRYLRQYFDTGVFFKQLE